ncbi:hypothetical protein OS493_009274 [Desmophyllum pertusum]|uniref:glutathione gamma-glutamylcysteinyltransferase n=1 Tax=Desmophyllum pertusum TaxID=174260 RepID=A0A9X0CS20_9CNID|nr:hypothetical protein OS493_009274 [Desmophyllum pertusum]
MVVPCLKIWLTIDPRDQKLACVALCRQAVLCHTCRCHHASIHKLSSLLWEELLDCCRPLEDVKEFGITLEEFVCLADCNGAVASFVRPSDTKEQFDQFVQTVERVCTGGRQGKEENLDEENPDEFMAISFSRKALGQTGDGHFSPIAAFDRETSSVLMFDTARFKYPPYWVPIELLFQSMLPLDSATAKSRGLHSLEGKT